MDPKTGGKAVQAWSLQTVQFNSIWSHLSHITQLGRLCCPDKTKASQVSSSSAFPSYISGVRHSSSAFPSYISGVHHSSSVFPTYISGVRHSSSSSAFPSYISLGFIILLLLHSPAISLGFTILLLLLHSPAISLGFTILLLLRSSAIYLGFTILLLLRSPAISLGFTILGEIFAYVTVFNPTIEVVTFRLRGWFTGTFCSSSPQ